MDWVLFGGFALLLLAGVPLAAALGLAGSAVILLGGQGIMALPNSVYTGIAKYPLLAVPVFVLAGLIFERAGVAASLVRFASSLVGRRRGALMMTAVLVCMILGGISGSGPADAAAVAAIMLPSLARAGYPPAFSASVIAAGASTAILIPPSIALIIYSLLVPQASVPALFAAGLLPGILAGIAVMVMARGLSARHGFGTELRVPPSPLWQSLKGALWGLAAPVIILGGMRSGLFTPTEAAVVAAFYGLIVGMAVYRSLTLQDIYELLIEAAEISGVILTIVALASVLAWASSTLGTFDRLAGLLVRAHASESLTLAGITVLLLVTGMFPDAISIYFIFLPLLLPIAAAYGWDPVWLGILITMNLAIGQFTPPMAVNLMVTSRLAGVPMEATVPWVVWMVAALLLALGLVALLPETALWLPRMLGYL